jgi:hypothetical protein
MNSPIAVLATFTCLLSVTFAAAQREGVDAQQNLNALAGAGSNMVRLFDSRYEGIRGNPFVLPYWCSTEIVFKDGRRFKEVPLKYDVYQNQIVIKRPQGDSVILNPAPISHFTLQDVVTGKAYLFKKIPLPPSDQGRLNNRFLQVIQEGNTSLVVSRGKSIVKADYKGAYNSGRAYDELIDDTHYYLLHPDGSMVGIRLNRKSVLEGFARHQAEIKAYAQQENIDFKDEKAVGKLVAYANTLD